MPFQSYIHEYHYKIQSGEIVAGKLIKLVYAILIKGLETEEYYYNPKKANKAIRFIETFCHHSKGRSDLIKLELWQKAMVSAIFGIVDEQGVRIWREVFIVIGRKNGKSLIASAITAYMSYFDNEYGVEAYCLAPKLKQAGIVFESFHEMVKNEPELLEVSKKRRSDIYIEETNSTVMPLAFNSKKSDGFNPHLVTNDEVASWRGDSGLKQYEVMASAIGARKQPLILSISTAGYENNGIYDRLINRATSFLKGNSKEKQLLPFIYQIDDVEKWNDITELRKANPNMGVSVTEKFFISQIAIAESDISKLKEFKVKYCNIKQTATYAWLEYEHVSKSCATAKIEDFKDTYAVGGIDLSQTTDLTAATVLIERNGVIYSFTHFFMPANRLEKAEAIDGVTYDIFIKQGVLTLSGENHVNYKDVFNWFIRLREEYSIYILKIGYDRYSAQYLIDDLKDANFHTDDVWQGENLCPICREFKGILEDGNFKIANNNLLAAHFMNVAVKENSETRRFRPVKLEARARIDGFVSNIDALTVRTKYYAEIGELLKNAA